MGGEGKRPIGSAHKTRGVSACRLRRRRPRGWEVPGALTSCSSSPPARSLPPLPRRRERCGEAAALFVPRGGGGGEDSRPRAPPHPTRSRTAALGDALRLPPRMRRCSRIQPPPPPPPPQPGARGRPRRGGLSAAASVSVPPGAKKTEERLRRHSFRPSSASRVKRRACQPRPCGSLR